MDACGGHGHGGDGFADGDGGGFGDTASAVAFTAYFAVFIGTWMLSAWAFGWFGSWKALLGVPIGLAVASVALCGVLFLPPVSRRL